MVVFNHLEKSLLLFLTLRLPNEFSDESHALGIS